jgi:hypothetical protein
MSARITLASEISSLTNPFLMAGIMEATRTIAKTQSSQFHAPMARFVDYSSFPAVRRNTERRLIVLRKESAEQVSLSPQ